MTRPRTRRPGRWPLGWEHGVARCGRVQPAIRGENGPSPARGLARTFGLAPGTLAHLLGYRVGSADRSSAPANWSARRPSGRKWSPGPGAEPGAADLQSAPRVPPPWPPPYDRPAPRRNVARGITVVKRRVLKGTLPTWIADCLFRVFVQEGMQQCPYLQEMKERLVLQGADPEQLLLVTTKTIKTVKTMDKDVLEVHQDPAVGTVVKVRSECCLDR